MSSLKIAIFGAGSIGCYVGGRLVEGGGDATFIGRERFQTELYENGLTLTHYARSLARLSTESFTFETDPSVIKDAEIILLCVKSQDTQAAAKIIAEHARADALVISFQNGVSNPDILRAVLNQPVLGAVVPYNVTRTGAGTFHCGTEGDLFIGASDNPHLQKLIDIFEAGNEPVRAVSDIEGVQWGKLVVNLNNGLNTLWGGTLKSGLVQRGYRLTLAAMMEEALGVLGRAGIKPAKFGKTSPRATARLLRSPNFLFHPLMSLVLKIDENARSSMLDDLEAGKPSEIDYLQGEIVRLAEKTGQAAPINEAVLKAVKEAFGAGRSPKLSGEQMRGLFWGSSS